jgi:hypothetical protein
MQLGPKQLENFIMRMMNGEEEPGFSEYRHHLDRLNNIISNGQKNYPADHSWRLEGSLFYEDQASLPAPLTELYRPKRRNYAIYALTGASMLEIGFNAGHSCLLALTVNRDLRMTCVDIGWHAYVQPCFDYLRSVFGDRAQLIIGDSRDVLPQLRGRTFDLFHIDGDHEFSVAQADLCNVLSVARPGSVILFDDLDFPALSVLTDFYCLKGVVSRILLAKIWATEPYQALLRVN